MFETVTVDEALAKGQKNINIPTLLIIVCSMLLAVALGTQLSNSGWYIGIGVVLSFVAGWLYWSIAITKWRLWAFDNVRNVHELKKRAIKKQLIWPDGNFLERTEIRSAADKAKWALLQDKFRLPDIFTDDLSVPAETLIRFSKAKALIELVLGCGMIVGTVCWFNDPKQKWLQIIIGVIGAVVGYLGVKHYLNREPQVMINNEGIKATGVAFYPWSEITNEDTRIVRHGKSSTTYLVYFTPDGEKKIDIGELDIRQNRLEHLLLIYRGRYDKSVEKHTVVHK